MNTRGLEPGPETGLTAFDLRHASAALGLQLQGYRLSEAQLLDYFKQGGLPVIAHVTEPRPHFVVVVGAAGMHLLLSDPGWGRYVVPIGELTDARAMSGAVLVCLATERQARIALREIGRSLDWMRNRLDLLLSLREDIMP